MTGAKFWKQSPPPYWRDLRALSLIIPSLAATFGAIAYSVQGIAFSQGGALPDAWVDNAIAWGAVLLGIGCEGGTFSGCIEIARKRRDGDAETVILFGRPVSLDGIGLIVSYIATVIARVLALGSVQSNIFVVWLLVLSSAADAYFLLNATGDYLRIRDRNMARWETARWYYEELHNIPAAIRALESDQAANDGDDMRRLKAHNDELQRMLSEANAVIDSFDNAAPVAVAAQTMTQNVISVYDNDNAMTKNVSRDTDTGDKMTVNGADNDTPVTVKKMTQEKWRAVREELSDKPLTPAELVNWLSDNGYDTVSERTAYRWLDDGAKRDK